MISQRPEADGKEGEQGDGDGAEDSGAQDRLLVDVPGLARARVAGQEGAVTEGSQASSFTSVARCSSLRFPTAQRQSTIDGSGQDQIEQQLAGKRAEDQLAGRRRLAEQEADEERRPARRGP